MQETRVRFPVETLNSQLTVILIYIENRQILNVSLILDFNIIRS